MRRGSLAMACIEDYDLPTWVDPTNPAHWLQIGAVVCFDGHHPIRLQSPTGLGQIEALLPQTGEWMPVAMTLLDLPTQYAWFVDDSPFLKPVGVTVEDLPAAWRVP